MSEHLASQSVLTLGGHSHVLVHYTFNPQFMCYRRWNQRVKAFSCS